MKLSIKKASLKFDNKVVDGVLLIVKKHDDEKENIKGYVTNYIPDEIFVALDSKPVFYTNNYSAVDTMLFDYNSKVHSFDENYISRSFEEKESGLFVNFFQPTKHYEGDPVYITVTKEPNWDRLMNVER